MKPIFTIHAGEYLVASEIENSLKGVNVWIPSKDTGVDLLLTDKTNKKATTLQVKFSKDYNATSVKEHLRPNIKGTGWWALKRDKIEKSAADFWIFILYSFERKSNDFVIIEPKELLKLFATLQRKEDTVQSFMTVTSNGQAFETRGLSNADLLLLTKNEYAHPQRDLTKFLNNWAAISDRLKS